VYTSNTQHGTLSPIFRVNNIKIQDLCNSDEEIPLIFEIWSFQSNGNHRIYGRVTTSISEINKNPAKSFEIIKRQGNPYGVLAFSNFQIMSIPTMMDYLRSGWTISLSVAIDFTASNGELTDPNSLHFINPYQPEIMNSYERAIYQVGKIIEPYDNDRQIPVFGFGAIPRFMGLNDISHCFHLNGRENPEVDGVEGILQAYRSAMQEGIGLYGPTNFSPCLQTIMEFIRGRVHLTEYHIMLYITDGAITDFSETIENIVEASTLPLSIIIIGVGNADFSRMDDLDADDCPLRNRKGKVASRDIVQFVPMNKYTTDITYLHEDVLREVPRQLVSYMQQNGISVSPLQHLGTEALF
jgi:copine 5/8/9